MGVRNNKIRFNSKPFIFKAAPLSAVCDVQSLLDIEWNDFDPKAIAGEALKVKGTG